MSMFYARNGDEITMEQWSKLLGDMEYKRVAITTFPSGRRVSTVWLGMDHSFSFEPSPPLIFETMVFGDEGFGDEYMDRYTTEEQALEGHERIANMVRELEEVNGQTRGGDDALPGEAGSDRQEDQEGDHRHDTARVDDVALHPEQSSVAAPGDLGTASDRPTTPRGQVREQE